MNNPSNILKIECIVADLEETMSRLHRLKSMEGYATEQRYIAAIEFLNNACNSLSAIPRYHRIENPATIPANTN